MYLLYTLPYLLLIVSMLMPKTLEAKKYQTVALVILALYSVTNITRNYTIFERRNGQIIEQHTAVIQKYNINEKQQILAPMVFVFDGLLTTKIQGFLPYILKHEKDLDNLTSELFFTDIAARGKDFALMTNDMLEILKLTPEQDSVYYGYRYLGMDSYLHIFKLETSS